MLEQPIALDVNTVEDPIKRKGYQESATLYDKLVDVGFTPEQLSGGRDQFVENLKSRDKATELYDKLVDVGFQPDQLATNKEAFISRVTGVQLKGGVANVEADEQMASTINPDVSDYAFNFDYLKYAEERKAAGEDEKKLGEINKKYNSDYASIFDDIQNLPNPGNIDLKQLAEVKKSNPDLYGRMVGNNTWYQNLTQGIARREGPEAAGQLMSRYNQFNLNTEESYATTRAQTKEIYAAINKYIDDPEKQRIAKAGLAADRSKSYGDQIIFGEGEETHDNPLAGKFDRRTLVALNYMEDVDPGKASMVREILSVPKEEVKGTENQIAWEKFAREAENLGLQLESADANEMVKQISSKTEKTEQDLAILQRLKERSADIDYTVRTQKNRYPAMEKYDTDLLVQNAIGQDESALSRFAITSGKQVQGVIDFAKDIAISAFGSDKDKTMFELSQISDNLWYEGVMAGPDDEQLFQAGRTTFGNIAAELQDIKNSDLPDVEKRQKAADIISRNRSAISQIQFKDPTINITGKTIVNASAQVLGQVLPQIAMTFLTGGGSNISRAGEVSRLFGSVFLTTYEQSKAGHLAAGHQNADERALIDTTIEAASEMLVPDITTLKRMFKSKGAVIGAIADKITPAQWEAAVARAGSRSMSNALKDIASNLGGNLRRNIAEGASEAAGQWTNEKINEVLYGEKPAHSGVGESFLTTVVGMAPLAFAGLPFKMRSVGMDTKYQLYEMGANAELHKDVVNRAFENGDINAQDKERWGAIIDNAEKAVKATPLYKSNGNQLSDRQKAVASFNNYLKIESGDIESIDTPSLKQHLQEVVKKANEENEAIASGADDARLQESLKPAKEEVDLVEMQTELDAATEFRDNLQRQVQESPGNLEIQRQLKDAEQEVVNLQQQIQDNMPVQTNPDNSVAENKQVEVKPVEASNKAESVNQSDPRIQEIEAQRQEELLQIDLKPLVVDGNPEGLARVKEIENQEQAVNQKYDKMIADLPAPANQNESIDIIQQGEYKGQQYTYRKSVDGTEEIVSPRGKVMREYTTRNVKGKQIQVADANFRKIKAHLLGEKTQAEIDVEDNQRFTQAIEATPPANERDAAMQYFATGGKVSPESVSSEIAGNNERLNSLGKKRGIDEYRWAWFGGEATDSIERVAEKIREANPNVEFDIQSLRNEIIDVMSSYNSVGDIQTEIVNNYEQAIDPNAGISEENALETWINSLPEEQATLVRESGVDPSLSPADRLTAYQEVLANAEPAPLEEAPFDATSNKAVVEQGDPKFKRVADAIRRLFSSQPDFDVIELSGQQWDAAVQKAILGESAAQSLYRKPNGVIYGFVQEGKMYLNGEALNLNTPIHEASHLFLKWARDNAHDLYQAGLSLMAKNNPYVQRVSSSPFYRQQIAQMILKGATPAQVQSYIADEALAMAVGDKGQRIVEGRTGFGQFLKNLWNGIRQFFGGEKFENLSTRQYMGMKWENFVEGVSERIVSGQQLQTPTNFDVQTSFQSKDFLTPEKQQIWDDIVNNAGNRTTQQQDISRKKFAKVKAKKEKQPGKISRTWEAFKDNLSRSTNPNVFVSRLQRDIEKYYGVPQSKMAIGRVMEQDSRGPALAEVEEFAHDVADGLQSKSKLGGDNKTLADDFNDYLLAMRVVDRITQEQFERNEAQKIVDDAEAQVLQAEADLLTAPDPAAAQLTLDKAKSDRDNALVALSEVGSRAVGGITVLDADVKIKDIVAAGLEEDFKRRADVLQKHSKRLMQRLTASGIISKQTFNDIAKKNDFYAPFQVVQTMQSINDRGVGSTNINNIVKKIKGISNKFATFDVDSISNLEELYREGKISTDEYFDMATQVANTEFSNGNISREEHDAIIEKLSDVGFTMGNIMDRFANMIFDSHRIAHRNRFMNQMNDLAKVDKEGLFAVSIKVNPFGKNEMPVGFVAVPFKVNGKPYQLAVNEKAAKALSGANDQTKAGVRHVVNFINSGVRFGAITLSAGFQVTNFVLDFARNATVSRHGLFAGNSMSERAVNAPLMVGQYVYAIAQSLYEQLVRPAANFFGADWSHTPYYKAFMESGGYSAGRYEDQFTNDKEIKVLKDGNWQKVKTAALGILSIPERLGKIGEESHKMVAMERGLDVEGVKRIGLSRIKGQIKEAKTPSDLAAALDSVAYEMQNFAGSPNFGATADWVKTTSGLLQFFSARVKGVATDLGRLGNLAGLSNTGLKMTKAERGTVAAQLLVMAIPIVLNAFNNFDDDDDEKEMSENISELTRNTNILVKNGTFVDANGQTRPDYIFLASRDVPGLINHFANGMAAYIKHKDPEALGLMAKKLAGEVLPVNLDFEEVKRAQDVKGETMVMESAFSSATPIIKYPYELATKRNSRFHNNLIPASLDRKYKSGEIPRTELSKTTTPEWANWVAGQTNALTKWMVEGGVELSPIMVDHFENVMLGGAIDKTRETLTKNVVAERMSRSRSKFPVWNLNKEAQK